MPNTLYKQPEFSKWSIDELLAFLQDDPVGAEWLDAMARNVAARIKQRGAKEFGIESAKELVAASICSGYFVPKFGK